jgi:hypothetical protein
LIYHHFKKLPVSLFDGFVDSKNYSLSFLHFTHKWICERKIRISLFGFFLSQFPNDIYYYFLTYQSSRWLLDKMEGHKSSSTDKGVFSCVLVYLLNIWPVLGTLQQVIHIYFLIWIYSYFNIFLYKKIQSVNKFFYLDI